MRKIAIASLGVVLSVLVSGFATPETASLYVDQERCLAIFNVATAALNAEDAGNASDPLLSEKRKRVEDAYDRLEKHLVSVRGTQAAELRDKGEDTFEDTLSLWLDAFGEAMTETATGVVTERLLQRADECMPVVPEQNILPARE